MKKSKIIKSTLIIGALSSVFPIAISCAKNNFEASNEKPNENPIIENPKSTENQKQVERIEIKNWNKEIGIEDFSYELKSRKTINEKNLLLNDYLNLTLPQNANMEIESNNESVKISLINNNHQKEKEYLISNFYKNNNLMSYKEFYDDIIDSANNDYPTFFFNRDAAQIFISSFQSALAQLELINKRKDIPKYKDVVMVVDQGVNNYDDTLSKSEDSQRFNFKSILDKFGDGLKNINSRNKKGGNFTILNNIKNVKYGAYYRYEVKPNALFELNSYLKLYLDKLEEGKKKINFYIPDISFKDLDEIIRNRIMECANKIVLLSDGNAQPFTFYENNYLKWASKQKKFVNEEKLKEDWENFQNGKKSRLSYDYWNYLRVKDKFKIFNLDGSYSNFFSDKIDPKYKIDVFNSPLNHQITKKELNLSDNFSDNFIKLNKLKDKTILDLITHNVDKYDSRKKNLVFIGSSLFRHDTEKYPGANPPLRFKDYPNSLKMIQKVFEVMKIKYPTSEYNYLFKLHPYYKNEAALDYVNKITNNFSDAIILDPKYSWETMLDLDFALNKKNKSVLFDEHSFKGINKESKTVLWGIQPTTTVILGTMKFLQNSFNLSYEETLKFVNLENFPISNVFHVIKRDQKFASSEEAYKINSEEINKVYKYFIKANSFPSDENFPKVEDLFKKYLEN